jgi:purine-nucleoside phosphorylase
MTGVTATGDAAASTLVATAADKIRAFLPAGASPRVALVLGSGLGEYAERLLEKRRIGYSEIGFPAPCVVGHYGNLYYGRVPRGEAAQGGIEVLVMQGRIHAYEGHDLATVVLPVRALVKSGCEIILLTNAAGGIAPGLRPGQLVLLRDHLNLMGSSPLRGKNDATLGPRFPDMSRVYDRALRLLAEQVACKLGLGLPSGVYAACLGPQYETPAEVRMLRTLGADLVGMSTVPEAIAARHMGARILGLSCVTNLAAGLTDQPLSHDEVTETAALARADFLRLLDGILDALPGELRPRETGHG